MAEAVRRFELAPMSRGIRALTAALLFLPLLFFALALIPQTRALMIYCAIFIALLYAAVWLFWRPTAFELGPDGLRIRFPLRTRLVAAREIVSVREVGARAFRDEFGFALRIGVGGLWGGFGWLWTRGRGMVEFYVSRTDGLVIVERRGGRALLFTPQDPEEFVDALSATF